MQQQQLLKGLLMIQGYLPYLGRNDASDRNALDEYTNHPLSGSLKILNLTSSPYCNMHWISTVFLYLLACTAVVAYELEQPLNLNFTIFDNFSNDVVSPGVGNNAMLEIKPNATDRWLFEQIFDYNYVIRHSTSHRYLHFTVLQFGATARLSETAATVLSPLVVMDTIVKFVIRHKEGDLWLSVEPYNVEEPDRFVIRLREKAAGQHQFTMLKPPKVSS
ncbi:hypothetical protein FQN49_006266 [Arthroderma sp. PD_2]|nr:hypothetical protein FQN49_006266 [Arthroderma sp. PD_2]